MSAAAAVVPAPEPEVVASAEEKERDFVIVDVQAGDTKVIQQSTSFTITWKKETGQVLVGTFTAQRPNLGQLGRIAVIKAKLNGGEKVDPNTDFCHEMMAALQVILTDVPDWWTPDEFYDARPLREVWDHVRRWIDNFRSRRVG
jgi:hypothetical protein